MTGVAKFEALSKAKTRTRSIRDEKHSRDEQVTQITRDSLFVFQTNYLLQDASKFFNEFFVIGTAHGEQGVKGLL